MAMRRYSKLQIATQQLDTALRLYFRKKEYFSVITLASAAEEILGVHLKTHSQLNAFEQGLTDSLLVYKWLWKEEGSRDRMYKVMNQTKNDAKHMMGKKDVEIRCDVREEARQVLDRAVSNYYLLMNFEKLAETSRIRQFNVHLVAGAHNKRSRSIARKTRSG